MKKWGLLFAIIISVCPAYSADLLVPDTYPSIQQAIDAANPGDTVIVSPGFYEENLVLGEGITLTSTDPSDPNVVADTIIDGGGIDTVITCASVDPNGVIAGFWIQNGSAVNGGGISCDNSYLTIKNCVFSSNTASNFGGGIFSQTGSPIIESCRFIGNFCDRYGGGIGCYQSDAAVTNCAFSGNDGYYGGGIVCYESDMVIINCTLSKNLTNSGGYGGRGGGIYFRDDDPDVIDTPEVANCILWDNFATYGNEIYREPTSAILPTFSYNDIQDSGGSGTGWDSSLGVDVGNNMDTDPNIIDADGLDNMAGTIDDNLHIEPYSVCINAGDPNAVYTNQGDMDFAARVRYGRVDIGADEVFYIGADLTMDVLNEQVDVADLGLFTESWLADLSLKDFALFAGQWGYGAAETLDGDLSGDGQVDMADLAMFVDSNMWLVEADLADFVLMAENWLVGVD